MLRQSYIFFHTRQFLHWCLSRWFLRHWTSVTGWQCLATLRFIFDTLGLASLPEKDSLPASEMVCLGILINTKDSTLPVPESQLFELSDELQLWSASPSNNCGLCSVNFLLWLLVSMQLVTLEMLHNLAWWQTFLPLYNGILVIKPTNWSFADFHFTMNACLTCGRAICLNECLTFPFPDFVFHAMSHISALERYTVPCEQLVHCHCRIKVLAPVLQHRRFLVSCNNKVATSCNNIQL